MVPAVYDTIAADIEAGTCLFRAQGSKLKFAGFTAVYIESREESDAVPEEEQEAVVPPLTEGEILKLMALDPKQHFTQPPPRYTEASLVKTLEERGIGRPSTYAQIISTIQDREYVRREKGTLFPTELGMLVTDRLVPFFPEIMDLDFTAQSVSPSSTWWASSTSSSTGTSARRKAACLTTRSGRRRARRAPSAASPCSRSGAASGSSSRAPAIRTASTPRTWGDARSLPTR